MTFSEFAAALQVRRHFDRQRAVPRIASGKVREIFDSATRCSSRPPTGLWPST